MREKQEREAKKNQEGIVTRNNPFVHIKNNTNGITLVALVVTIVVLLILAGITINMLFGENGIIRKAQEAADATRAGEVQTQVDLWNGEKTIIKYTEGTAKTKGQLLEEMVNAGILTLEEKEKVEKDNVVTIGGKTINFGSNSEFELEIVQEYAPNIGLAIIYTNQTEFAYATKSGKTFYDITDSKYKYNGNSYTKIYGMVFNSKTDNITQSDISEIPANEANIIQLIYDWDLDESGSADGLDAGTAASLKLGSSSVESNEKAYLKCDINKDKKIDGIDTQLLTDYAKGLIKKEDYM